MEKGTVEVTTIELPMCVPRVSKSIKLHNNDLTSFLDFDALAQLTSLSVDLYAVMEEFLKCSSVKNTIIRWTRKVNGVFVLGGGGGRGFRLDEIREAKRTGSVGRSLSSN